MKLKIIVQSGLISITLVPKKLKTKYKKKIYYLFDLAGHTANNRLDIFLSKSAPKQISWCGWLASTGVKEMDYFIVDKNIYHSKLQNYFTEKLLVLDKIWNAYSLDDAFLKANTNLPYEKNGYLTFGAFHNSAKINDFMVKTWAKILENNKNSKLHLLSKEFEDKLYKNRTIKKFEKLNIDQGRLIFSGFKLREKFLNCYNTVDVILDTWPYGGGSSSFEAIGMNVPIITCKGESFLQRCGHSININLGFEKLTANNINQYIDLISKLKFEDLKSYKEKLSKLDKNKINLFNSINFAENMSFALNNIN